jgi:integrase
MGVKVRERNGAWWVFVDYRGKRKAKRVGTGKQGKKAAELAATKIAARLADGGPIGLDSPKSGAVVTFALLADEWLRIHPAIAGISSTTLEDYRSLVTHHLVPFFNSTPVSELDYAAIERFIVAKRTVGGSSRWSNRALGVGRLRNALKVLRLILTRAVVVYKILPANPAAGRWRLGANTQESADPFIRAELQAILTHAHDVGGEKFATMLRLWAQTGMRLGEVSALQHQDLDLKAGTVTVQRTWSKGRLGPTKTRRIRVVNLCHPIVDDDPQHILPLLRAIGSIAPDLFLFGGDRPWANQFINKLWHRTLARARVRYREPEQLRHTFASTMLSQNAPLLYVAAQGGWKTSAVLLRVYARWLPEQLPATQPQSHATTAAQMAENARELWARARPS